MGGGRRVFLTTVSGSGGQTACGRITLPSGRIRTALRIPSPDVRRAEGSTPPSRVSAAIYHRPPRAADRRRVPHRIPHLEIHLQIRWRNSRQHGFRAGQRGFSAGPTSPDAGPALKPRCSATVHWRINGQRRHVRGPETNVPRGRFSCRPVISEGGISIDAWLSNYQIPLTNSLTLSVIDSPKKFMF